jgi:hypothetical protein
MASLVKWSHAKQGLIVQASICYHVASSRSELYYTLVY